MQRNHINNESKEIYQKVLEKSDYRQTLKYHPVNENFNNNKRNRTRNVTWFNRPFKTKVVNYFLNLIRKYFPPSHNLSKSPSHHQSKLQLHFKY